MEQFIYIYIVIVWRLYNRNKVLQGLLIYNLYQDFQQIGIGRSFLEVSTLFFDWDQNNNNTIYIFLCGLPDEVWGTL